MPRFSTRKIPHIPDSKSHLGGLELPMTISLLSRYAVVSREHAMGQWFKDKMMIPFYLETTAAKSPVR